MQLFVLLLIMIQALPMNQGNSLGFWGKTKALFSPQNAVSPKPTLDPSVQSSIAKINTTLISLKVRRDKLQKQVQQADQEARVLVRQQKQMQALEALKRKRIYQNAFDQVQGGIDKLQRQLIVLYRLQASGQAH